MIFVGSTAFAQKGAVSSHIRLTAKRPVWWHTARQLPPKEFRLYELPKSTLSLFPWVLQYPNNYVAGLSFFCRNEWKFEKATGIPLRIRLGGLQQCDWLEGKKYADALPR